MKNFNFIFGFILFGLLTLASCSKESSVSQNENNEVTEIRNVVNGCNGSLYTSSTDCVGPIPPTGIQVIGGTPSGQSCCATYRTYPNTWVTLVYDNPLTPNVFDPISVGPFQSNSQGITPQFCFNRNATCVLLKIRHNNDVLCLEMANPCN